MNRQNITWVLVGIVFALGSIWVHYQVKVEIPRRGSAAAGQLGDMRVGGESPDFSAIDLRGRQVVLSEFRDRKVVVGADGRIEWIHVGYSPTEANELRELLKRLTGESQSVGPTGV